MPKFENTQSILEQTQNNMRYNSTIYNTIHGINTIPKINFTTFVKIYPSIEELSFLGFFTALDLMTLRLLCRDCAMVFNEDVLYNIIRMGNLDD